PVAVVVGSLTVGLHGLIDHLEVGVDLALLLIGLDAGFADKLHVLVGQAGDRDALILDHLIGDGHIIVDVTGELLTAAEAGGALKGHLIGLRQAFPGLFVHHDAVDTGGLIPGGGAPVGGDLLQLQGVVGL
ncbi:30S ribosome-binding factor RbfA, partial [Dysosmobacter welbionis]